MRSALLPRHRLPVGVVTLFVLAGCGMDADGFREFAKESIGVEGGYLQVALSPSRIRPDLTYAIASANVDDVRRTQRVVAVRDGHRYVPLGTFADWESAVLAGWGEPELQAACVEAANITIWLEGPWRALVYEPGGELDGRRDLTGLDWERIAPPRVVRFDETELVELWIIRPEESARIECRIVNGSVVLREVEVLEGTGLLTIDL
jgi:hypothetical protein